MKLHSVEIENFRSIASATIDFTSPCRILVGKNESGKSNILKALALLENGREPVIADKRQKLPGRSESPIADNCSYVRFVFRLEEDERAEVRENVASAILAKASDPAIVSIGDKEKTVAELCATYTEGLYRINIPQNTKESSYWKHSAALKLLPGWKVAVADCPVITPDGKTVQLANYRLVRPGDFSDIPESALKNADAGDVASLIGAEVIKVVEENLPNALLWQYAKEDILPDKVQVNEFAANPDSCIPLKNMFILADYDDIPGSIKQHRGGPSRRFQNFLRDIARQATEHFHSAWGDYKSIMFTLEPDGDFIVPGVKEQAPNDDDANTYGFADRSDGFKRFVTFLLMVSAKVEKGSIRDALLLIDEPEASLHPTGAQALRDLLIKISDKNLVVYSTHSTHMIDRDKIDRHYIVTKADEKTCAEEARGGNIVDEEVLYDALGISVFDTLKPRNIIFEGWRDKHLFKVALEEAPPDIKKKYKRIGVCHVLGVKDVRYVAPTIELAGLDYIVISDGDRVAVESQNRHGKQRMPGQWFTYQNLGVGIEAETGEDFIRNDTIAKKVNSALAGADIPEMDADDLPLKKGKLGAVHGWLFRKMSKEHAAAKLKEIKGVIFDELEPADIDMAEYEKLLRGILLKISKE